MNTIHQGSKAMHIALWITQVLLAACFVWASTMKLFQAPDKLAELWPWTVENVTLTKLTGILDFLAGIGLVLPSLLRIQPKWTVNAAYGTIALMIAATAFHISRGEASQIGVNLFFAACAAFIAWGRWKRAAIVPR